MPSVKFVLLIQTSNHVKRLVTFKKEEDEEEEKKKVVVVVVVVVITNLGSA
jgi:hypothetical protein